MKKLKTLKIGRYVAALLLVVIAIVYVNIWFYKSFKNQAEEVNEYVQDQMIARISEYYDEINQLVTGTLRNNEILQLQNFSNKDEVYRSETVIDIVNRLRTSSVQSSMVVNDTYIYIDGLELVISKSGIIEAETYYDIVARNYFNSYDMWIESLKSENQGKTFLTNNESIMFSFILNRMTNFDGDDKQNIIIGSFADKRGVFVKTPHIDWINQSNIYVYNRNGEISICEENINIDLLSPNPGYSEILELSSDYDVISYDVALDNFAYTIFLVFKRNLNMQNVKKVQFVSIITIIVSFLLAFYYFYNLYKKRYKPIKAISTLLNINVDKIDYTLIEKPLKNIVEKNQLLNQMIEKNNSSLKLIILKRLLTGDLSKEFMKDLENLGIELNKEGNFVVVVRSYTDSDISESDNLDLITAIQDEIKAIVEEHGTAYFVLDKQYIICICNTDKDFDLRKFGSSILDAVNELEETYAFVASVAISNMHTRYWHISKGYAEAMEAISNSELYDKSKVVLYEDVIDKENEHKFSLDDETKLTEAIKNGDNDAASEIIKNIIGRINPEKTFLYMNVSVGLVYSLMRIADLLFGEEVDAGSVAYLLKNTDDLNVLSNACLEFAETMCDASKKNQGDNKIAGKVLEFIQNNYSNSQLTAKVIAEEMNYSFVYLNNLFKQEYSSTIIAYLNYYRVERAKELINQNFAINEAAKAVGVLSIRTFNRQFQSLTGMTPTEYKKDANRKEEENE